jgi:hypothetical protein
MSDAPSLPPKDADFLITEYQEAAKAYALGVQVGQAIMGSYLVGTGVLATFLGVVIGQLKEHLANAGVAFIVMLIALIVGLVGIFASRTILSMLPRYGTHLESCRKRCAEIETHFGGKLFSLIGQISDEPAKLDAIRALQRICRIFIIFWIAVLVSVVGVFLWIWVSR